MGSMFESSNPGDRYQKYIYEDAGYDNGGILNPWSVASVPRYEQQQFAIQMPIYGGISEDDLKAEVSYHLHKTLAPQLPRPIRKITQWNIRYMPGDFMMDMVSLRIDLTVQY